MECCHECTAYFFWCVKSATAYHCANTAFISFQELKNCSKDCFIALGRYNFQSDDSPWPLASRYQRSRRRCRRWRGSTICRRRKPEPKSSRCSQSSWSGSRRAARQSSWSAGSTYHRGPEGMGVDFTKQFTNVTCGQSYKASTSVNYDSGVVNICNLLLIMALES